MIFQPKRCFLGALGAVTLIAATSQAALISYWDFEGDFVDSVGVNNATLIPSGAQTNNATTGAVAGRAGASLILDGLGDGLVTPTNTTLDFGVGASFTYSFWVKAQPNGQTGNDANRRSTFLMRDTQVAPFNGVSLIANVTNTNPSTARFFRATLDGGDNDDSLSLQTTDQNQVAGVFNDAWHHIALVVDTVGTGMATLYLDGNIVQSLSTVEIADTDPLTDLPGTTSAGSAPLYIGAERATGTRWLFGAMDDLAVWGDALPTSSIQGLANGDYTPLTAPIPEPSGFVLAGMAITGMLLRRRKQSL